MQVYIDDDTQLWLVLLIAGIGFLGLGVVGSIGQHQMGLVARRTLIILGVIMLIASGIAGWLSQPQNTPPASEIADASDASPTAGMPESTATLEPTTATPLPTAEPPTAISEPSPPMATPAPSTTAATTATPAPRLIQTINVPGTAQAGEVFVVPETGRYRFDYNSGAYAVWPQDHPNANRWRTLIHIYQNRPIEWGYRPGVDVEEPVNPEDFIGWWEDNQVSSVAAAAELAQKLKPQSRVFELQAGDRILFVPIDENNAYTYATNRGEVTIDVWILSP